MIDKDRRGFFKKFLLAGAVLAAPAGIVSPRGAAASAPPAVNGICLRVPHLEVGAEFAEKMKRCAPGSWRVHILKGSVTDFYFETRALYEEARAAEVNTFLGVADPATFAVIREAIEDSGGRFHYIDYEDASRVNFSVRV